MLKNFIKTRNLIPLFFVIISLVGKSQVISTKSYLMEWEPKYVLYPSVGDIRQRAQYIFIDNDPDIKLFFSDSASCVEKLKSREEKKAKKRRNYSCLSVDLFFEDSSSISLFFNNNGDYYFDGKWYKMHPGLYYYLFRFFSNSLVPASILEIARKENKGEPAFW